MNLPMDSLPLRTSSVVAPASFLLILLVLEELFPLRPRRHRRLERWKVNLGLSALSFLFIVLGITPISLALAAAVTESRVGAIHWLRIPWMLQAPVGLLLMDLTFYYWHFANHRVPFLWRFHIAHHIDPDVDVTTAIRFHFGEILLSIGFRALQIALTGVSPSIYLLYEIVFQADTLFHHSNVRLPVRGERALNAFVVTPRMHGIHHSAVESETNSNYSVVLSCWDRIHGTLRLNIPQSQVCPGVPAYLDPEDNSFWNVIVVPFSPRRDAWLFPNGSHAARPPLPAQTGPTVLVE